MWPAILLMGLLCTRPGSGESSGQERRVGPHNEGVALGGGWRGRARAWFQPAFLVLFFLAARFGEGDNRDKELNPFLWVQSFGAGWKRARLLGPHSSRSSRGRAPHLHVCSRTSWCAHTHTHTHTEQLAGLYNSSPQVEEKRLVLLAGGRRVKRLLVRLRCWASASDSVVSDAVFMEMTKWLGHCCAHDRGGREGRS